MAQLEDMDPNEPKYEVAEDIVAELAAQKLCIHLEGLSLHKVVKFVASLTQASGVFLFDVAPCF